MNYQSLTINGYGLFSRDFTYIDNVLHMNELAIFTENTKTINTFYNTAFGDRTNLNDLVDILKEELSIYDSKIKMLK
jgi:UDP-N-acetylglucosamine 4-epimerase